MNESRRFNWTGWLVFLLFLFLWEYGSRLTLRLQLYIPPPSDILRVLSQSIFSGEVAAHLVITLSRFVESYLIAAAIGVSVGVILGYFRFVHSLVEVVIEFLRPMPSVAIIPVAILLLGLRDSMIVVVTVYASVWPILVNTIDGVRHMERTLINTGRTFGLRRRQILWQVVLPAASPYIVTGLRVSLSIALILVTTAEMIAGSKGLGFFILDEERSLRTSSMYAGIILVALLGYMLNRFFLALERRAMKWRRGMIASETI